MSFVFLSDESELTMSSSAMAYKASLPIFALHQADLSSAIPCDASVLAPLPDTSCQSTKTPL